MSTNDPDPESDDESTNVEPWQVQQNRDDLREQGFDVPRGKVAIIDWLEDTAGDVADALGAGAASEDEEDVDGPDETDEGGHVEFDSDAEEGGDALEAAVEEAAFDDESDEGEDEDDE